MAKKVVNRFNELQPNSNQRMELLIVMEYLQKYAYDEEHASTQKEIIDYAQKEYGVSIRRDRIGQILIHLEQLSQESPQLLPFVIKSKVLKKTRKYYVPQKFFTPEELLEISSAIKADNRLSEAETNKLIKRLLDTNANTYQKDSVEAQLVSKRNRVRKRNDANFEFIQKFDELSNVKTYIKFKIKKPRKADYSSYVEDKDVYAEGAYGYAYCIYDLADEQLAVIYDDERKVAIAVSFAFLESISFHEGNVARPSKKFDITLRDGTKTTIKNWLDSYFKGQSGLTRTYKLKFTNAGENETEFHRFRRDFEEFWGVKFECHIERTEVESPFLNDENGNPQKITIEDAFFEIKSNHSAFRNWYIKQGNYNYVIILEPKKYNELLLRPEVERLMRRINKYGDTYDYTLSATIKPEAVERLQAREANRREFLKRREEWLKKKEEK